MSSQTLTNFLNKIAAIVQQNSHHRYVVAIDGTSAENNVIPHNGFHAKLQKLTEHGKETVGEVLPFYYVSTLAGHDWQAKRDLLIASLKDKGLATA